MRKHILFIILLLFFSCSKESSNSITLFNEISFEIRTGEALENILPDISDFYSTYFNNRQPQIPLFKFISHPDYKIFIGIPYNTSIDGIVMAKSEITDSCRIIFESNSDYFFTKLNRNGYFMTEYARVFDKGNIIYIAIITEVEEISDSLFNRFNISERLKIKTQNE